MEPARYPHVEKLIDTLFTRFVPHGQYRVVNQMTVEPDHSIITPVVELYDEYISPFSSIEYDYKLQALINVPRVPRIDTFHFLLRYVVQAECADLLLNKGIDVLWAYIVGARLYEDKHGYPSLHMASMIATHLAMGWEETIKYEY